MTSACLQSENMYAKNFWSVDTTSQSTLLNQNEKSTKTLHLLSTFYKEFTNLESEYSRKLNSLVSRLELPKYEGSGTLKTSLDVFQEQCINIAESHTLQSRRVQDNLQVPLLDLISERKARQKALETKIHQAWIELGQIKTQCETKATKFENIWNEMSTLKSTRLTLDHVESQKLEDKLSNMKIKMLKIREENWELVNKYNEKLDSWILFWWNTCNDLQIAEEKRIRFLKSNLWEFSNICSTFCVEEDQYAENMRVSLQDCSAKKDINYFVSHYQTGDNILAPIKFVDFAKNEQRPLHDETTRKFDISEFPELKKEIKELPKKKNPPPKLTEAGETAFSYISKSKETYKQLQEEAQNEASQIKLTRPKSVSSNKSLSEPSTYKVMSDYSNPTAQTSISSQSIDEGYGGNDYLHTKENRRSKSNFGNYDDEEESNDRTLTKSRDEESLIGFKNQDIFRDSMSPSKDKTKTEKHNSFATLVKNKYNSSPKRNSNEVFEYKQILPTTNRSNNNIITPNENQVNISNKSPIRDSNSISKSPTSIKTKNISPRELPTKSSEGYPVIMHAKALYSYNAAIEEELSFKKRDILLVLHKQPDNWWFAENINSGDSGLVPSNYLAQLK